MNKKYVTRIFIIEDDKIMSKLLKFSLDQNDLYDVWVFDSGETFFENIHLAPDIVLIDYNLPGMSGMEILKRIKQANPDIATVFLSAQEKLEVVVEAYN